MPTPSPVFDWSLTRITTDVDLDSPGRRVGDLRLKHSDDRTPLGYVPIPVGVVRGGPGPTVLLSAGVHGDELEGPVALLDLLHRLSPSEVSGRVLVLPALNAPALRAGTRVSPLDGANLNRAFPGDRDGGPTAMIAHLVEAVLLPGCDAAIDLHSGGRAAVFTPCAMAGRDARGEPSAANLALAEAFGVPLVWLMGPLNDDRSLNAAAARRGVTMIAVELGGGGAVSPGPLAAARDGVARCLRHLGVLAGPVEPRRTRRIEVRSASRHLHAPRDGIFAPGFEPGDEVSEGQPAGSIHSIAEPERAPARLVFPATGVVLSRCHRGLVERGELLATVAVDAAAGPEPDRGG